MKAATTKATVTTRDHIAGRLMAVRYNRCGIAENLAMDLGRGQRCAHNHAGKREPFADTNVLVARYAVL